MMYLVILYDLDGNVMKEYGPMALDIAWEMADTLGNVENKVEVVEAS